MTIPRKGVEINSKTPTARHSLILDYFREAFHLYSLPCNVEEGHNGICHKQWPLNKWGSCPYVNPSYRLGGGKKSGHGDHLLWSWSSQAEGFWCTFCPTSTHLTGAKCGHSEDVHQHSIYPLRVLPISSIWTWAHSLGCFICPIPTGLAMSMQIALLLWDWGALASRRGRDGVENVSLIMRGSMAKIIKGTPPLWSLFTVGPFISPSSILRRGNPDEGKIRLSPSYLKLLQDANQARDQLECELVQETQVLAWRYDNKWTKQAKRHEKAVGMDDQADRYHLSRGIFPGEFSRFHQITALVHFLCYIRRLMATTMQESEDVPAASEPEGWPAPGPSGSPTHLPITPPLPVSPLPDIPFVGTPLMGHPFAEFLAIPTPESETTLPAVALNDHCNKRTYVNSKEVEARSEHNSAQGDEGMPKLVLETGLQTTRAGTYYPPFYSNQGHHWSWWCYCSSKFEECQWSVLIWLRLIQGGHGQLWYGHSFWGLHHLLRHRWSDHMNHLEEVPEEGINLL